MWWTHLRGADAPAALEPQIEGLPVWVQARPGLQNGYPAVACGTRWSGDAYVAILPPLAVGPTPVRGRTV